MNIRMKSNERIVDGLLASGRDKLSKLTYYEDTGFFYASDGFRAACIEASEIYGYKKSFPIFDNHEESMNFDFIYRNAADREYINVEIPYTAQQIMNWYMQNIKNKNKPPFCLGVKYKDRDFWFGINPTFLVEGMTTTGSNILKVPTEGSETMLMSGKSFTWLIMPIRLQDYEQNKKMTVIGE